MKLKTHLMIVENIHKIVYEMTGINLNIVYLKLGSIDPDVNPKTRFTKHELRSTFIQGGNTEIKLDAYAMRRLSFKLGRLSHYVADSFCLAHNNFFMDVKKHYKYEKRILEIQKYYKLEEQIIEYVDDNISKLDLEFIKDIHKEYLSNISDDVDENIMRDIEHSIKIGSLITIALINEFVSVNSMYAVEAKAIFI